MRYTLTLYNPSFTVEGDGQTVGLSFPMPEDAIGLQVMREHAYWVDERTKRPWWCPPFLWHPKPRGHWEHHYEQVAELRREVQR